MSEIKLGNSVDRDFLKKQPDEFGSAPADGMDRLVKEYKNVKGSIGSKQATDESMYGILDCVEPPYNMRYLAKLYETSSIHAGAVDAKVDNIVGLGWYLENSHRADELLEAADKKTNETSRDALERRLAKQKLALKEYIFDLNNIDEFDEVLSKCMKDLFTTGNGYIEIGRDAENKVAYVGHVPSVDIRVRRKRDGFVQYTNSNLVFFRNFGDLKTPDPGKEDPRPNELIHFKTYSPSNNFYGVPDVISAMEAVAGIEFASKYNIEYFENKAVPKYVIKVKGMDYDTGQLDRLMKFFDATGNSNSHRTIVVPIDSNEGSDITFEPVETGKQDASFKEYTEMNINMILSRHRVPKNRLGISEGQGLSSSRDADKIFKESVCRPIQRLVEKKLQKAFGTVTDLFKFKLSEYSLTDEETQTKIDEMDIRMGALLPDERRAKNGLKRRPDGKGDKGAGLRDLAELGKNQASTQNAATRELNENKVEAQGSRQRDQQRATNRPDGTNSATGRNPKGQGRKTG